jgi:uncharacterized protein YjiS (DUF1127 family)
MQIIIVNGLEMRLMHRWHTEWSLFPFRVATYIPGIRSSSAQTLLNKGFERDTKMNFAKKINDWRKYRETVSELGRMSDRELSDLGIGRADIRRVARTAVGF